MLAGSQRHERDARELGGLLKRKLAHVNLIPFNPVEDTPYHAPDARPSVLQRDGRGAGTQRHRSKTACREADAACGQLHERVMKNKLAVS